MYTSFKLLHMMTFSFPPAVSPQTSLGLPGSPVGLQTLYSIRDTTDAAADPDSTEEVQFDHS